MLTIVCANVRKPQVGLDTANAELSEIRVYATSAPMSAHARGVTHACAVQCVFPLLVWSLG